MVIEIVKYMKMKRKIFKIFTWKYSQEQNPVKTYSSFFSYVLKPNKLEDTKEILVNFPSFE